MHNRLLSQRVQKMAESATLKMSQLARDLRAEGHDVISLSIGEPDFDTPSHIKEAAKKALDAGYTKYTPVPGLPELKEAIVEKFRRENQLEFTPAQIVVSNGAKQSIANLALALLDEGDEVILFTPYWVSYIEIIRLGGGIPVEVKAGIDQDFKVNADQLSAALNANTKMVLFSSPCNPTGSVYHKTELEALAQVLEAYPDVIVVSDEIYEHINFLDHHTSIGAIPSLKDRTVTVNGFSKGFAMTGWRLGYMGAPEWIAKACTKIQGQITSGATAFGQKAAAYALRSSLEPTQLMKEAFLQRRNMFVEMLNAIEGFQVNQPQGAFYVFPNVEYYFGKEFQGRKIENSDDFAMFILEKAHVALVSGAAFGNEQCVRLSYAASEKELTDAVERIKDAVALLK